MSNLKIGWGKREISIDEPVNIPGQFYMRRSNGVLDPLYITALCLDGRDSGGDLVIFCSVDSAALGEYSYEALKELEKVRPEIPTHSVIMNCTHTHSSLSFWDFQDEFPDGSSMYNSKYVNEFFTKMFIEAVLEAYDSRKAGKIAYGYGYAVVAGSRRVTFSHDLGADDPSASAPNGFACMYGRTSRDDFWGYEAGSDHFLNAMYTLDEGKNLTGIIVNVPCPSQLCEKFTMLSGDYWNDVREGVKKEFGKDVYILPQCAAAGDLTPRLLHYKEANVRRLKMKYGNDYNYTPDVGATEEEFVNIMNRRKEIAEQIVNSLKEVYSWAKNDIQSDVPVYHIWENAALSRRMITEEEKKWCLNNLEALKKKIPDRDKCTDEEYRVAITNYNSVKDRNLAAVERFGYQNDDPKFYSYVHVVRVGEIGFTTTKFELYMDFMHRIQARSPFIQTFVVQLCGNGGGTYLATKRAVDNKGYSASLFCNQVGPEGGQELVELSLDMLKKLHEK